MIVLSRRRAGIASWVTATPLSSQTAESRVNRRFGSGRITNDCGSTMCSTSPPGCTGSSSRAIPAISTRASSAEGSGARCSRSAGTSAGPIRSGRRALSSNWSRASGDVEHLGEQLVQVEHLDAVVAQRRGELVVLLLRAVEPRHAVEQEVVVVAGRESPQLGPGAVQDDRPQPPDLAPHPVPVLHDVADATGHNGGLLGFLIRRLFFALVVLLTVAVIDYGMFGDPLAPVLFHLDCGRACSHYLFGFGVLLLFSRASGLHGAGRVRLLRARLPAARRKRALGQDPRAAAGLRHPDAAEDCRAVGGGS